MRRRCVLGLLIVLVVVGAWRALLYVPKPGIANVDKLFEPEVASHSLGLPGEHASVYTLSESEVIRHVRSPDAAAREELLRRLQADTEGPIVSVTVLWDGDAHIESLEVGVSLLPRTLYRVLVHSLELPTHMFERLEIAHGIELPGDWVIRRGAGPNQHLPHVGKLVRESGHPSFAFVRKTRDQTKYTARGTPRASAETIRLFAPFPGTDEPPPRRGSVGDFLRALSAAIGAPISNELSDHEPITLAWIDNSSAHHQLGAGPTEGMLSALLQEVASALQVTLEESEYQGVIWRLEYEPSDDE
jgi:hypothetical protein